MLFIFYVKQAINKLLCFFFCRFFKTLKSMLIFISLAKNISQPKSRKQQKSLVVQVFFKE